MKALVTGGGGFLGSGIARRLVERGDWVRSFSRGDYPQLAALGVEQTRGDLSDGEAVAAACHGIDIVYHVAARPGVWGPWKRFFIPNVVGTQHVLAGCRRHGVSKLVYTSSPSAVFSKGADFNLAGADESLPYPKRWGCHYSATKAIAEQMVLQANDASEQLSTVALRPHLIWGPGDNHLIPRLLDRARRGRLVRVGDGTNRVDLTYIDNAVHAHLLAGDRLNADAPIAGNPYFITDGRPVLLWAWIDELLRRVGLREATRRISFRAAHYLGAALEAVYGLARLPGEPPMTRFTAGQLAHDHYFSIDRARRDLGYEPVVKNETGVDRLVEWIERNRK